jgi:predicted site-specific integrase-resolvase
MANMGKTATIVAQELGCSVATISRWVRDLEIKPQRYGASMMLCQKDINKIMRHKKDTKGRPKKIA